MATGGLIELAIFGAYTFCFGLQEAAGFGMIVHGLSMTTIHGRDLSFRSTNISKPVTFDGNYSFTQSSFLNPANGFPNILHNTNPFDGPITEGVIIGDNAGNNIPVSEGQSLTGSADGTWIQVRDPFNMWDE